jgi:hypothetical protein
MKEYKKNQESKDEVFEKRRNDSVNSGKLENVDEEEEVKEVETKMSELDSVFSEKDAWTQKQEEQQ